MSLLIITNLNASLINSASFGTPNVISSYNGWEAVKKLPSLASDFQHTWIINDRHPHDDQEFTYFPAHMCHPVDFEMRLRDTEALIACRSHLEFREKSTPDALHNVYNLHRYNEICVVGFLASFDVLATIFGCINRKSSVVTTASSCLSDISQPMLENALRIMSFYGIRDHG